MIFMPPRLLPVLGLVLLPLSPAALAASSTLGQGFHYQGRLLAPDGAAPMSGVVDLTLGIYSSDGACLLYEEKVTGLDLDETQGFFSVLVGSAAGDPKRTARDPGKTLGVILANGAQVRADHSTCPGGYTPASGEARRLRVTVQPQGGVAETLSPDLTISPAPQSFVAETLQGLVPDSFIQAKTTVTQNALGTLTAGASSDASSLHNHDGLYAKLSGSSSLTLGAGQVLGLGSNNGTPAGVQAGDTWFDSADNKVKYWDGTQAVAVGSVAGGVTSFNTRTGAVTLSSADVTTALGFTPADSNELANATSSATNSTLVKRDASGNFSAGTITANLTGNVTGNVSGTAANVTGTVAIANGGTGQTTAAAAFNALAPSQTGNSGKFLTTNGTTTSWAAVSGGQWTTSGSDIYYNTGNVGMGTTAPLSKLSVNGGMAVGSYAGTTAAPANGLIVSGPAGFGTGSPSTDPGESGTNNVAVQINGGQLYLTNVTIGTPRNIFTFNSTGTNFGHFYSDGVEANNSLSLGGTSLLNTVPATPVMTWQLSSGNVGIGTADPATKLAVSGTVSATSFRETVVAGGTCSTSYSVNPTAGTMFTLTLNGACSIGVTNLAAGHSFAIRLTQAATTAPTFAAAYKWPGGAAPTWSTSATKYDVVACASFDGSTLQCSGMVDVR